MNLPVITVVDPRVHFYSGYSIAGVGTRLVTAVTWNLLDKKQYDFLIFIVTLK